MSDVQVGTRVRIKDKGEEGFTPQEWVGQEGEVTGVRNDMMILPVLVRLDGDDFSTSFSFEELVIEEVTK